MCQKVIGAGELSSIENKTSRRNENISFCSLNVCGFNSKLKYNTLQEYIKKYDGMCLSETKCHFIAENKIISYKPFITQKNVNLTGLVGIMIFVFSLNPT